LSGGLRSGMIMFEVFVSRSGVKKFLFWAVVGGCLAAFASLEWYGMGGEPFYGKMSVLDEVLHRIEREYVEEVDIDELFYGSLRGMVQTLDPYCDFVEPQRSKEFEDRLHGSFEGLGIYVTMEMGYLTVIAPIEGTPAFEAGIMPGDRIIAIDGVPVEGMDLSEAVRRLKGKRGTVVRLDVIHRGESRPTEILVRRDVITIKSVCDVRMIDHNIYGIGYVRITRFQDDTVEVFRREIGRLKSIGLNGLIIDLRNNPGGALDVTVELADLFLQDGVIVKIKERGRPIQEIRASKGAEFGGIPVAILVNRGTASAAEVFSGAMQDNGAAILVGERTFGKGSVQTVYELASEPSLLKLTTALYFTPNGHSVHKGVKCLHPGLCYHRQTDIGSKQGGLRPNLEVTLAQGEERMLRQFYRQAEMEGRRYSRSVLLAIDRQLRAALDVLRNRALFEKTLSCTSEEF